MPRKKQMSSEILKLALEALEDLGMKHFESTGEVLYKETFTAIKEALAQPEQEPVAWMNDTGTHIDLNFSGRGTPLYITPPQRTWVGLTDEEISAIDWKSDETLHDFARAIEAKLKQKNT